MTQSWGALFAEKSQSIIELMMAISASILFVIFLVIMYFSYIGNCPTTLILRITFFSLSAAAFIIDAFPMIYSQIIIIALFIISIIFRRPSALQLELKQGILSSNIRYRKREKEAFDKLTEEQKLEWIQQHEESQNKKLPIWVLALLIFPPYIIGLIVASMIPR